jgi:HSP20 family protein
MIRRSKNTDIARKTNERGLLRAVDARSPFAWFDEMDRWFDDFRREVETRLWGPLGAPTSRLASPADGMLARSPLVDVVDTGREFVVRAEVPGVAKEDLDVHVTSDGIDLRAESNRETEEKETDYYYRERAYSAFHRSAPFPDEVLPDQAEANLKDGVLEVRIPKKEATPRREPVKVRVN